MSYKWKDIQEAGGQCIMLGLQTADAETYLGDWFDIAPARAIQWFLHVDPTSGAAAGDILEVWIQTTLDEIHTHDLVKFAQVLGNAPASLLHDAIEFRLGSLSPYAVAGAGDSYTEAGTTLATGAAHANAMGCATGKIPLMAKMRAKAIITGATASFNAAVYGLVGEMGG